MLNRVLDVFQKLVKREAKKFFLNRVLEYIVKPIGLGAKNGSEYVTVEDDEFP